MKEAQDGKCAICHNPETRKIHGRVTDLAVDHDHETGVVRGLLCHRCNFILGLAKDKPQTLLDAAAYLLRHKT